MQNLTQITCPVSPQWFLTLTIWLNISNPYPKILLLWTIQHCPSSDSEVQQRFWAKREGKVFLDILAFTGSSCPMVAHLFCYGSPWMMRADYQQARAVFSNTCLTGPFIKHAKTTHNTDQNEKSVFTGQTAKLVYAERFLGESAVLQTWWDGIKWKIIAISSEPRITLREKKKLSQQGKSWNAAYLLIHSVELSD